MNKYCKITLDGSANAVEQFSAKDVALVYLDSADDVVIVFNNGSKIQIASSAALIQADVDVVFGAIKNAQESRWHKVLVDIPLLSQPVNAFTFTF